MEGSGKNGDIWWARHIMLSEGRWSCSPTQASAARTEMRIEYKCCGLVLSWSLHWTFLVLKWPYWAKLRHRCLFISILVQVLTSQETNLLSRAWSDTLIFTPKVMFLNLVLPSRIFHLSTFSTKGSCWLKWAYQVQEKTTGFLPVNAIFLWFFHCCWGAKAPRIQENSFPFVVGNQVARFLLSL